MRRQKLITHLREHYNVNMDWDSLSEQRIKSLLTKVNDKKKKIQLESEFNSYFNNPTYTKCLIIEGILHSLLKEIKPVRTIRRKRIKA